MRKTNVIAGLWAMLLGIIADARISRGYKGPPESGKAKARAGQIHKKCSKAPIPAIEPQKPQAQIGSRAFSRKRRRSDLLERVTRRRKLRAQLEAHDS